MCVQFTIKQAGDVLLSVFVYLLTFDKTNYEAFMKIAL